MMAVAIMEEEAWHHDPIVLVNMTTQETVILHGDQAMLQASMLLNQNNGMIGGLLPASTGSIQAMREVEMTTEYNECSICLERIEGTAKEMMCLHRFHGDCIERWLRIHGSCPLCRFVMPLEKEEEVKDVGQRWRTGLWVTISIGNRRIGLRGDDSGDGRSGGGE